MKADDIRDKFLSFFEKREHRIIESDSLVPDDPTLLFTSAGMVQFKDIFWGELEPKYKRAATCQKCFRTNDIENVGKTAYHHTFFEMLGNFSFGDYFKEGVIELAWEFVTEKLGLPPQKLWVSVYREDEESYQIWRDKIGIPKKRIEKLGKDENWWGPVGDTGPCGPDTEIFYDAGKPLSCGPDCRGVACDCNRFNELWNLVLMQYEAGVDGSLEPLKKKNIDTGMGLERTATVMQGVESDFETDIFQPIVKKVEALSLRKMGQEEQVARNVIADHIRGLVFLIADGVVPSNEGRGYVLRRVLRRTVRQGLNLDIDENFLHQLIPQVIKTLGDQYPEIVERKELVENILKSEEDNFRETLQDGEKRFSQILKEVRGGVLPGEKVFELYDTYGFPPELTQEMAGESGLQVDMKGFEKEMEKQKERSRALHKAGATSTSTSSAKSWMEHPPTEFKYESYCLNSEIIGLYVETDGIRKRQNELNKGELGYLIFKKTPFYAESGGQIADSGKLTNCKQEGEAKVMDVQKEDDLFLHQVEVLKGTFSKGDECTLSIDLDKRKRTARNHTATHILHTALRNILGNHVIQSGSMIAPDTLRFDFNHYQSLSDEEIEKIEDKVNQIILANLPVKMVEKSYPEAKKMGAIAHFEEEYRGKEKVRVIQIGEEPDTFSRELCGGTHVDNTGKIGGFKILSEEGIAAGTRRIRAATGENLIEYLRTREKKLEELAKMLETSTKDLESRVKKALQEKEDLEKTVEKLKGKLLVQKRKELLSKAESFKGIKMVSAETEFSAEDLKVLADQLLSKLGKGIVILGGKNQNQAHLVCKVSDELTPQVDAGKIINQMAKIIDGGGGGNPRMAFGGGKEPGKINQALSKGLEVLKEMM